MFSTTFTKDSQTRLILSPKPYINEKTGTVIRNMQKYNGKYH